MLPSLFLAVCILLPFKAFGLTRTWTGIGGSNWATATSWSGSAAPTTGDDIVFDGTGVVNCSLSVSVSVTTITFTSAYTGNFNFGTGTLTITGGAADFRSGGTFTPNAGTLSFAGASAQAFTPKTGATFPVITKSAGGIVTITTNPLTAGALTVSGGTWDWGASPLTHAVASIVTSGSATMTFGTNTVQVTSGNADFSGLSILNANTGNLQFTSGTAQTFTPKAAATHPNVTQNGAGGTTIATNGLATGTLTISSGTLNLGAGLTHSATTFSTTAGGLDFGSSTLQVSGSTVNLNGLLTFIAGTGTLEFTSASAQTFTPKSGYAHPSIKKSGSGVTTLSTYGLNTGNVNVTAGTFDVSTLPLNVTGTLTIGGGTLTATSGSLGITGDVALTSGTLNCPGSGGTFTLTSNFTQSGGTLNASNGTLTLNGAATGRTLDIISSLNNLTVNGASGIWTVTGHNLVVSNILTVTYGTLSLGSAMTVDAGTLTSTGGTLDFGSSTLRVTSGNANLSALGTLTPGTGTLAFTAASGTQILTPKSAATHPAISHTGASTLQLATYALSCNSFSQSAGVFDFNALNVTTVSSGNLTVTNGTTTSFTGLAGRTLTVAGNASFTGTSGTNRLNLDPGAVWTLAVTGTLTGALASVSFNTASLSPGTCTNCANAGSNAGWTFNVAWDGGGADFNWTTAANWASKYVPTALDNVTFDATSTKNVTLDVSSTVRSITMTSGYTGAFSFSSSTLNVSGGNADFRSGGTFSAGTGLLTFTCPTAQTFYPKSGATFPAITQNGAGGTTISTNALIAGNLTLTSGTFNLGASMTHYVGAVSGSGGLDFGTSNMNANGNVDLSGATITATASSTLAFIGPSAQTYTPKASVTALNLTQDGSGGTTVATNNFTTPTLTINTGIFNLGTSRTHTVSSGISFICLGGGGLDFSSSTLKVAAATVDFTSLVTLTAGTGTLELNGASAQTFKPKASTTHPSVIQSGTGGTTLSTNGLTTATLTISAGTLTLGSGLVHSATGLSISGGGLDFGSSTLKVSGATVNLASLTTLTAGTGTLEFTLAGNQTFTPKSAGTHPNIKKSSPGTTTLATYNLSAGNVDVTGGGTLDVSTLTLTVGGNLTVSGATLTATSGSLAVNGNVTLSASPSGTINCPNSGGSFTVTGNLSQAAGTSFIQSTGTLTLNGTAASKTIDIISSLNNVTVNGTGGGWTVTGHNLLVSGTLTMTAGTLNLGTSLTHDAGIVSSSGGTLDFNTSTLRVTSGDANLSSLGVLTAGSGTLQFIAASGTQILTPKAATTHPAVSHTGAGTLRLATNALSCNSFSQSAGTFDLNSQNVTTVSSGNFTVTNGTTTSFTGLAGRTLTVAGNASFTGTSNANRVNLDPGTAWTLAVTGALTGSLASVSFSTASVTAGSCTNCANAGSNTGWTFAVTWGGGGADNNWTTAGNWASGYVPTSLDAVTFDATSTKNATLDAAESVKSIVFTSGYTGVFSFSANTLTLNSGNADFRSGGTITAATGALAFTSATAQTFYPKSGATFPAITQNGAGGTTISTNALTAGNLTLTSGTFNLGASMTHNVGAVSGSGGLDFGTSNLNATGNVDLSGATITATASNTLAFTGSSAQTYTPKASVTALNLTQNGSGGTTVATNNFTTSTLTITTGTLNLSTSRTHTVTSALTISGGGLDFSSSTLEVQAATVNLASLATLTPGTGTLKFTGSSAQTFTPKSGATHPDIKQYGSGGTTIITNNLTAGALILNQGTFNLGTSLSHTFTSVSDGGGGPYGSLDFNSSQLHVTGAVSLTNTPTLTPGTGGLYFDAASGTQNFTPKSSGATHPAIFHAGAGTVKLYDNLTCKSFTQSAGTLDFNAKNLTTVSSGNFTVTNGTTASFTGLAGRTLTVAGNASFTGTSGANRVNLDPGTAWTLAVTGTLTGSLASVSFSTASVTAGSCTNCANAGSNTGWTFAVTWGGGGADNNWTTAGNWASGYVPTSLDAVTFDATSVKNATLDVAASVKSIAFTSAYTGVFSFSANTLTINSGNADFRLGGTLSAGTGGLTFTSGTAQTFYPTSGSTFPAITQNGTGGTTISTNYLVAGNLTLTSGTLNLGSSMTHYVGTVSGSGGLDFGTSNLSSNGNVDLSGATVTASSSNTLYFSGSAAQTYTPKASVTALNLTQNGTGGTTIATNNFTTPTLTITTGTLNLGTALSHTVSTTLSITGGGLNFSSSTLKAAAATVNLNSLSTLTASSGTLEFTGSSAQTFTPKALGTHPAITQSGSGGTTISTNALLAGALTISAGTFTLGSSFTHGVASIATSGGGLDFSSSTLQVTGNVNVSGLATLIPGTGALTFTGASGTQVLTPKSSSNHPAISHTGASTLQLATYALSCASFSQSAGTFDLNSQNVTTVSSGNFTVTNGTTASFTGLPGRTITVAGNASFTGTSGANRINLNPGTAWTLAVTGTLTGSLATVDFSSASLSPGTCTNCANAGSNVNWTFAVAWNGGGADNNWTTAGNWGSAYVPTSLDAVTFDATSTKNATLDAAATVKSITFTTGYTGIFSFSANTLTIAAGNADFSTGGSISAGTGGLAFTSASAQTFIPKSGATFPAITQNGAGGTTISTNALTAGNLTLTSGTFNLGSSLTHNVGAVSGSGGLNFGTSNLNATGNVDLSGATVTASTANTLAFIGTTAQTYTPKASVTALNLSQNGSATTTVATNNFTTPTLTIAAGILNLGTSLSHVVSSTLTLTGGSLNFSSSVLKVAAATVNLTSLASLTPGTGTLEFTGTSAQTFTPKAATTLPAITQSGTGGTTVATNVLTAGALNISAGTFTLGSGFTHAVASIASSGGGLDFGSSTLQVTGNANVSSLATLTAGTGTLAFTAASGTQVFTPKASTTHPAITHTAAGTLQLATNALTCNAFTQSAGTLDFNALNLTTVSSGNLTVTNGTSATFTGLGGRTLIIAGNASFTGQSGNLINMDPGTAWTLAATGTLTGTFINLANCNASVSAGTASNSADGGSNTNWTFSVTWTGAGADNNWSTGTNWASGVAPGATIAVVFDGASTKNATLSANASAKSITFTSGYTGVFSFSASTLSIAAGNADFRSGGSISAGTGILAFVGTSAQTFIPLPGATFPAITQNGSGTTTVSTNALTAGNLTLSAGTFNLGTGFTHTLAGVSGGGGLDFGTSNLNATGNVDLSNATVTASSSNTLAFTGASAQTYTPKASVTALNLTQNGSGGTTVATNNFTTPTLTITAGTLNLGATLTHTVSTTLSITGGGLYFSSSTLKVAAATVDLASLTTLTAGSGALEFTRTSAQTFKPKAATTHPAITQSGSGGTTIITNALTAGALNISAGTFTLGSGFTHTVASIASSGGGLDFGSSTLQVTGNANVSSLATLTAGTGSLIFSASSGTQVFTPKASTTHPAISHIGPSILQLATNALTCNAFSQLSGILDFNGVNLTTVSAGNFTISSGSSSSFTGLAGRTITVAGNASLTGQAGNFINMNPASAWTLAVTGTLAASLVQIANNTASASPGSATSALDSGGNSGWTFSLAWDGGGADNNWTTAANWSGDVTPSATSNVAFDATSVKNCKLDGFVTLKSITFVSGYTGTFDFLSNTLSIAGNADFRSGGAITASSGMLAFTSATAQTFIPKSGAVFPAITQNGTGVTTLSTNPLTAGNLTLTSGTLNLGSGLTHTVASVSGGGGLDFASSTLKVTGNLDLSGLGTLAAGTGKIEFSGSSAQTFTPKAATTHPRISLIGTGTVTVSTNGFNTSSLRMSTGALNLGAGLTHSVVDTLVISGGDLNFSSAILKTAAAAASFTGVGVLTPGSGTLEFNGASAQTFSPKASAGHPNIVQSGAGGTKLVTNPLTAGTLTITAGTFSLGDNGYTQVFSSVTSAGGGVDFSNSILETVGGVDFSGLAALTAGTGALSFKAASGTQVFKPKNGMVHPIIVHDSAGTLQLSASALLCKAFTQSRGPLDLNGFNLTVSGTGNLSVTGPASPFANLAGRTLTVGGNAAFRGVPATHLALNPASAWTLAVTGSLSAVHADIRNSLASIAAGLADSSLNLTGNTNWTFLDTVKPDNVTGFIATAAGGTSASLAWTGSISSDADSVMIRYRTDGTYPLSRLDGTLWRSVPKTKTSDTATGLPDKTIYSFAAFVKDSSGNWSPAANGARDTAKLPDVTPPANVSALAATALGPTSVALSWTPPVSPDADTVLIRYRTGMTYPANATDGIQWKKLPVAANKDTLTGLTGNTIYAVGFFVRDSSGNYSPAAAGAQDTALYQASVSGSLVITDLSGRTNDVDPALNFTYSGADSLRFALLSDTALAAWKPLRSLDSLPLGASGDGTKIVLAQFKNVFGKRSLWYRDTTLLDRLPPSVTFKSKSAQSRWNWPDAVIGNSRDSLAGLEMTYVVRKRLADGFYYNGPAWIPGADTLKLIMSPADTAFSAPLPNTAMSTGDYLFTAYARDRAGNVSAPVFLTVHYDQNRAPALAAADVPDTTLQNQAVKWTVDVGDYDAGDSLTLVSYDTLPWLKLAPGPDTAYGAFGLHKVYKLTGTPLQAHVGNATLTMRVQDKGGQIFTFGKAFNVKDVNDPPKFAANQDTASFYEDSVSRWKPKFTDPDPKDPHTFAFLQAPSWASIEDTIVVLKPGSRDVGKFPIVLTVSDGKLYDTLKTTVTVINVNDKPYPFASDNWRSPAAWKEDAVDSFTVVVVDMDKGDPVTLSTPLPPFIRYQVTVDPVEGYNRFFKFTVKPGRVDTGSYSWKLRFEDAAGAANELPLQAKVVAVNHTPTAVVKSRQTSAGAARITFDVQDMDGSLAQTRFHYRLLGPAGDTLRSGISAVPVLVLHPLADGDYRLAVAAEDEAGLKQGAYTMTSFTIGGATILALDSARWNMIGFPGRSLAATRLGAGSVLTTWDESSDDGAPLGRYASGKSADSLVRGKGYWVRVNKGISLSASQADLLDKPFTFKLSHGKQGWNQIGNPFPYYVDLASTGLQFWEWDPARRDLVNTRGLLKPWGAYWVQVSRDTIVEVKNKPYFPDSSGSLAKMGSASVPSFRHSEDWTLQMSLQAGPYQDQANFLGIHSATGNSPVTQSKSESAVGLAISAGNLVPDAPKFGDYIALHFEKPDETNGDSLAIGYAADFRGKLDAEEEWWDFTVENSESGFDKANLSLPGLEPLLNSGLHVFLVRRGEAMPVSGEEPAILAMEGRSSHYSLVVTPHADFAARLKGNFSISQNFPNPVSTQTTFRFVLPQTWGADGKREAKAYRLRLNVYDFSGRLAAQVADGSFKPGSHALLWKPQAGNGGPLAQGAYVYRLEAAGFAKSLKMIVK